MMPIGKTLSAFNFLNHEAHEEHKGRNVFVRLIFMLFMVTYFIILLKNLML